MPSDSNQIELHKYIQDAINSKLQKSYTCEPCKIISFDTEKNRAKVKLDLSGDELEDVPIAIFGNPQSYITVPIFKPNTQGFLMFSHSDLGDWIEDGEDKDAAKNYNIDNAVFITGVTNDKNTINYDNENIVLKSENDIHTQAQNALNAYAKEANFFTDDLFLVQTKNIELEASASTFINAPVVNITAPQISLNNANTSDNLTDLLDELATTCSDFADILENTTANLNTGELSTDGSFSPLAAKFTDLASRLKSFNQGS